jgi:signal transduction histidine kinase
MRRRLILTLLAFAAVALAGFVWPLLTSAAAERTQHLLLDRTATLDRFATLAQQAIAGGELVGLRREASAYADLYQESVLILDQRRTELVAAGGLTANDPGIRPLVDGALRNERGQPLPRLSPWSSGFVVLARPIGTGTRIVGVVALRVSVARAAADVAAAWTLILVGAAAAAAGFVLLALGLARWVLRPLARLERGVSSMAAGRRDTHVPRAGGPPELRALTDSFNQMSEAVAAATRRERELVADASHQLRNPMAALRLRVDTLASSVSADGTTGYRSLAAEVDRLESLLDGLLTLASADQGTDRPGSDEQPWCRPDEVIAARAAAWAPAAARTGTRLVSEQPDPPTPVACPESELAQVLDVLLDNAIRYAGSGASITMRVEPTGAQSTLTVADDGPGLSDTDRHRATQRFWRAAGQAGSGTGLGLAIAERLVTARAGTLRVEANHPRGLAVRLTLPNARDHS